MRPDRRFIEIGLGFIGREDLKPVGTMCGLRRSKHGHSVLPRLLCRAPPGIKSDDYVVSAVTEVLRLSVSLRPVAKDSNGLCFQCGRICILLVKDSGHWKTPRNLSLELEH